MPINPPNPPVIPPPLFEEEVWMYPSAPPVRSRIGRTRTIVAPPPSLASQGAPAVEWLQGLPIRDQFNWFADDANTAPNQGRAADPFQQAAQVADDALFDSASVAAFRRYLASTADRNINPPRLSPVFTVLTGAQREFYEAVYHGAEFVVGHTYNHNMFGVTPSSCSSQQELEIVEQRSACGLTSPNSYDSMEFRDERPRLERNEIEALPLPG